MHSRIYAFQQTGRGFVIPKVEVEKIPTDIVLDCISVADYVDEMDIDKLDIEDDMETLSNWGNGKIFNVSKVGKKYFVTVDKNGIFKFVESNCARLRKLMDDDKNFVHNVIKSFGGIITYKFDDTEDIYICLDGVILPIFQFIYFYYICLYKSVGDDSLLLTQLFDYHF